MFKYYDLQIEAKKRKPNKMFKKFKFKAKTFSSFLTKLIKCYALKNVFLEIMGKDF